MDTEFPSFVRACRHDSAIARLRADDDRASPVLGMIALFTARVECVEVDVGNPAMVSRSHYGFVYNGMRSADSGMVEHTEMSLPDRDNPYSFEPFTERRDAVDFFADDPFLRHLIRHHAGSDAVEIEDRLAKFSPAVSFRWRELAETVALPENRPWMMHYNGRGERIDRIVRPRETEILEREIFGAGIFAADTPLWERLGKLLLLHQNGEHGVMCAMACTEGMIALLEAHLDGAAPQVEHAWRHCKEGIDGKFGTGSQFLTEIQGGSDVPANLVEAVAEDDHYRLHGVKFFCSARVMVPVYSFLSFLSYLPQRISSGADGLTDV